MLEQADKALKNKIYKDAQKLYKDALDNNEDAALSYLGLSIAAYHLREYQDAYFYSLKALEIREDLPNAHLILGYIYAQQGNLLNAEKEVNKALVISPDNPHILAFGGGILVALQKIEDAREMLHKARALNPDDWIIYYNLGSAYLIEKRYNESVQEYLKSFHMKKSISTLSKIVMLGLNIFIVPVMIIFAVLTLIAFSFSSQILLLILTTPIILFGLIALRQRDRMGISMILLGVFPLIVFYFVNR